jgi:hypothetical protein
VCNDAAGAANLMFDLLQNVCYLPVQINKLVFITSSTKVKRHLLLNVGFLARAAKKRARNLGADFGNGRNSGYAVQNIRVRAVRAKVKRLLSLGVGFATSTRIFRSGFIPAAMYGTQVTGMSKTNLACVRRCMHVALFKKAKARSCTADLCFAGLNLDPTFNALKLPINMWTTSLWNQLLPSGLMLRLFSGCWDRVVSDPSAGATGPASACAKALLQLGWKAGKHGFWVNRSGVSFELERDCPKSIALHIDDDISFHLWSNVSCNVSCRSGAYSQLGGSPWLEPVHSLLQKKDTPSWGPKEKGLCRTILAEGCWPLERLRLIGLNTDGLCVCGGAHTLFHILWECPLTAPFRDQYGLEDGVLVSVTTNPHLSLWRVGLLPDPTVGLPPPCLDGSVKWHIHGDDGPLFCCHGYGDGSGLRTQLRATRRCGWSVVAAEVGDDGIIRRHSEAYGPLAFRHQNVHSAELYALLFYLRHATSTNGYYVFFSDCAYVVDGFMQGCAHNTHGWAVDADLWRQVFSKVDDLGEDLVLVHKIKAHRKSCDAVDDYDRMQIIANNRADALAKLGACMHDDDLPRRKECINNAVSYKQVLTFMTKCLAFAIDRKLYQEIQEHRFERLESSLCRFVPGSLDHKHFFTSITPEAERLRCIKCFSPASSHNRQGSCSGDVWAKGHRIARLGHNIIFCIRCGAYSVGRVHQLMSYCAGAPWSSASRRAKSLICEGRHPNSGVDIGNVVCLERFFKCVTPVAAAADPDEESETQIREGLESDAL